MRSAKWTSSGAAAAALCVILIFGPGAVLPAAAQSAAQPSAQPPSADTYMVLEHRSANQMTADDVAVVRTRQKEIAAEAAMFGYDLSSGNWTYDQAVCPDIPEAVVLHYRTASRNGAQSLFTAVVPRAAGRVLVVPILYRGATPFRSATGQVRTLSVFNRSVPAGIAKEAVQPDGQWLTLAMCFAEIAGAEPRVPQHPDQEGAIMVKAPAPTLHMSAAHGAQEIQFAGREAPGQYTVWTITVNAAGRATAAQAATYADNTGQVISTTATPEEPSGKKVTRQKGLIQPKVVVIPEPPAPPEKTTPQ